MRSRETRTSQLPVTAITASPPTWTSLFCSICTAWPPTTLSE
jgi:hypothetical protein